MLITPVGLITPVSMDRLDASRAAADAVPEEAWTVSQLNRELAAVIAESNGRFPAYVLGEIADVSQQ